MRLTQAARLSLAGILLVLVTSTAIAQSPTPTQPSTGENGALNVPISDPLPILGLAYKLNPKAVITVLHGCFSVGSRDCTQPKSMFTPDYASVLTKFPSTRIIAALLNCSKLEAVSNEFQMRDLDIGARAAVENAAQTAPTRIVNVMARAQAGSYDFTRQGFSLKWQQPLMIFQGRKVCRGQKVEDAKNEFPTDFYVRVDPVLLPEFMPVAQDKARAWVESNKSISVSAAFSVDVRSVERGILKISGAGIPTGWVFSGAATLTRFAWVTGDTVVEEVAVAARPETTAPSKKPPTNAKAVPGTQGLTLSPSDPTPGYGCFKALNARLPAGVRHVFDEANDRSVYSAATAAAETTLQQVPDALRECLQSGGAQVHDTTDKVADRKIESWAFARRPHETITHKR